FRGVIHPTNKIIFMAHHDTVHRTDGMQKVFYDTASDVAYVDHNECLGADCTTGVFLILEMIRYKVPGLYIIHTGEECGGIGSSEIVRGKPKWLNDVEACISFDRYGTNSIITHQMGQRTCSESFANDLESILKMNLKSDSGGVYTDSYEYCGLVSECTNISVGYYNQHTSKESQDMNFIMKLRDALINADWSKIRGYRDPTVIEYDDWGYDSGWTSKNKKSNYVSKFDRAGATDDDNYDYLCSKYSSLERVVEAFPYEVSQILQEYGYDKEGLIKDILNHHSWMSETWYR
ncbi:M28 family peptidase, partial [Parabacteroides distasonis]|nr:M28 family peptidase [Parabacteroides distasonis]